jgi:hypothetical protein
MEDHKGCGRLDYAGRRVLDNYRTFKDRKGSLPLVTGQRHPREIIAIWLSGLLLNVTIGTKYARSGCAESGRQIKSATASWEVGFSFRKTPFQTWGKSISANGSSEIA